MPKGKNRKGKTKGGSSGKSSGVTRQSFRFYTTVGKVNTANTVVISEIPMTLAQFGSRAISFADMFAEWRMLGLRATGIATTDVQTTATQAVSFYGSEQHGVCYSQLTLAEYTAPSTMPHLVDFPNFSWAPSWKPVHLTLRSRDLVMDSPFKWLLTNTTGTTESSLTSGGTLTIFTLSGPAGNTITVFSRFVVEVDVEFKGPLDTAMLPLFKRSGHLLPHIRDSEIGFRSSSSEGDCKNEDKDPGSSQFVKCESVPPVMVERKSQATSLDDWEAQPGRSEVPPRSHKRMAADHTVQSVGIFSGIFSR